jgi:hypothetical protein
MPLGGNAVPRSRNVRLTPVQRDLLWAVEDAGAEDLWTVWITVQDAHDSMPSDQFRAEFVDGLLGLSRLGYVRVVRRARGPAGGAVDVPHEALERLWVGEIREVGDGVEVEMTDAGYRALGTPGGVHPQ